MSKNLTVGSPLRLITLFALPLLIGNIFQQAYSLTDAIVVGRLIGVEALAAVGASGSLVFLLFGFAMGASAGLTVPVARAFGAGDLPAMRRAVATGALLSLAIAVIITLIGTLGASTLLTWLDTPPELMPQARTFLAVFFGGSVVTTAFNYLSAVIRALGDSTTPLIFLVLSCVLNVALVIGLIGGLGMGVGGAALATVLAQLVSALMCLVLIWRRMPLLHLRREDWRVEREQVVESNKLGLAMGFQMSILAIGAAMLQYGINGLGTTAVAAFTAAMRVEQLAFTPLASVGVAMTTYVAQNAGALRWHRILVGVRQATWLALSSSLLLAVVIFLGGTAMVRVFVGQGAPEVVAMAHRYLVLTVAFYWVLALIFIARHVLQGLGEAMPPTVAGVLELLARGIVGVFVVPMMGFPGVILATVLAWAVGLLPLAVAWHWRRRRIAEFARLEPIVDAVAPEPPTGELPEPCPA